MVAIFISSYYGRLSNAFEIIADVYYSTRRISDDDGRFE